MIYILSPVKLRYNARLLQPHTHTHTPHTHTHTHRGIQTGCTHTHTHTPHLCAICNITERLIKMSDPISATCPSRLQVMFQNARDGIPHIGIVITDGVSEDPEKTSAEAQLCKDDGITMFALGVGQADQQELHNIASADDMVYMVDNYAMLDTLKEQLAWKACESTSVYTSPVRSPPLIRATGSMVI